MNSVTFLEVPAADLMIFAHDRNIAPVNFQSPRQLPYDFMEIQTEGQGMTKVIRVVAEEILSLDKVGKPCSSEADYSFIDCWEKSVLKDMGCQLPWTNINKVDVQLGSSTIYYLYFKLHTNVENQNI